MSPLTSSPAAPLDPLDSFADLYAQLLAPSRSALPPDTHPHLPPLSQDGTLAGTVWDAALVTCRYLVSPPGVALLAGRRVAVELGAGTGVVGITVGCCPGGKPPSASGGEGGGAQGTEDVDAADAPGGGKKGGGAAAAGLRAVVLSDLPSALPVLAANVDAAATAAAAAGVTLVPTAYAWGSDVSGLREAAALAAATASACTEGSHGERDDGHDGHHGGPSTIPPDGEVDVVLACDVLYAAGRPDGCPDGDVNANHSALLRSLVALASPPPATATAIAAPERRDVLVLLAWERRLGAGAFEAAFFAAAAAAGFVAEALTRERLRSDAAYNWVDVVRLHWKSLPPGAVPHRLSLDAQG
ncbi:hypothetical protein MMPV_005069 [Pyropia vietnamensis]